MPNPGFEQYDSSACVLRPTCAYSELLATPLTYHRGIGTLYWYSSTLNHASSINEANITGYHLFTEVLYPRSGHAFIILTTYGNTSFDGERYESRSYAQVKLKEQLKAGCTYEVTYYVRAYGSHSLTRFSRQSMVSDGVSAYFSTDSVLVETRGPLTQFTPQIAPTDGVIIDDTIHYTKVSGTFVAEGGEQFLLLGNFKDNANTPNRYLKDTPPTDRSHSAQYLVDDVSVTPVPPEGMALNIGNDTTICDTTDISLPLAAPEGFQSYLWSTGDTTSSIEARTPGTYWIKADYGCGTLYDTINIGTVPPPPPHKSFTDTTLCHESGFPFTISAPEGYTSYTWGTGNQSQSLEIRKPGTYSILAEHICGLYSDTVNIKAYTRPETLVQNNTDTVICENRQTHITAIEGYDHYTWSTEDSSQSIQVSEPGTYSLHAVSPEGCVLKDSVTLVLYRPPNLPLLPEDTLACKELPLEIVATEQPSYYSYQWNGALGESTLQATEEGSYKLTVSNQCFSATDSINVKFTKCTPIIPNLVTPNNDGHNDLFQIVSEIDRQYELRLYNRWGKLVFMEENTNNWDLNSLNEGVYYYAIYDHLLNDTYKGYLHLVR
ncbi:gliding motility-associated C-terminal domain-containing protein [Cytophagaceae bacterium ABcell3]|nr:gliding motility-associated C-terminal domain-containing protein [Cytophagaceae bacterium ABcell3]